MVELTGDFGPLIQELLEDLHSGIDAGKKTVHAVHDFDAKLQALNEALGLLGMDYMEFPEIHGLFTLIGGEVEDLSKQLEILGKKELHILLEEEAAEAKGKKWILKHRKLVEGEIKSEKELEAEIVRIIHKAFVQIRKEFTDMEHLFEVDISKAEVTSVKEELKEFEEEFRHVMEKLMQFFAFYEHFFQQQLAKTS